MRGLTSWIDLKTIIFVLPAILISLTFHEFAHAAVAYSLGDFEQKEKGRLSLNPLKHIDPLGFIMLILFNFGWAKPVTYDDRNIKNKKSGRIMIAMSGPFTNLILGFIFSFILGLLSKNIPFMVRAQSVSLEQFSFYFCMYLALINFGLFVFNMIPVSPLDGSHVVAVLFNLSRQQEINYQRWGMPILLLLIFSDRLFNVDLLPIWKGVKFLFTLGSGLKI